MQLMGYFRSPLIVMPIMLKSTMAGLVRRFYDVCKYKASLGTDVVSDHNILLVYYLSTCVLSVKWWQ